MLATPEEQEKPKPEEPFKEITDKIEKERMDYYKSQFEQMTHSPQWQLDGYTFHYRVQSFERLEARSILEAEDINELEDRKKYAENYYQRAVLLMKEGDMTREIFKEIDFYELENLVTAWSVRSGRGFPKEKQSIPVVV